MTAARQPRVVHALPGRVRLHLPSWRGVPPGEIENRIGAARGVRSVQLNPLTGNLLIEFDPRHTSMEQLQTAAATDREPNEPAATDARATGTRHALQVHGLKDNPDLGERLVEHLARYPGVQSHANSRSGQLFVDTPITSDELGAVMTEVRSLETPVSTADVESGADFTATDTTHAPSAASLMQSGLRLSGAAAGLAAIGWTIFRGRPRFGPPIALRAASAITILQSMPQFQDNLAALVGRNAADVSMGIPKIIALTLGASPLGLAVAALEALHLYTALRSEEDAWEDYEDDIEEAEADAPGTTLRIEPGERVPFEATIAKGVGTAITGDGLPRPATPGDRLPAGLVLHGGPFLVQPHPPGPFLPALRPVPPPATFFERYLKALGPTSLAYAGATALLTRSLPRTIAALLLVNARAGMLGVNAAATDSAARVVSAGATMVASRPARVIRLPGVLLLDSPSLLTRGLELANSLSFDEKLEGTDIVEYAAGISAATGSPWGSAVFRAADAAPAVRGEFDGVAAVAEIDGRRYALRPAGAEELPSALRLQAHGQHVLLLSDPVTARRVGAVVLRPRLARGTERLLDACRAQQVEVVMRSHGDAAAAEAIARRAEVSLVTGDAVKLIHQRQQSGATVMFLSASNTQGSAFLAADLALGLTDSAAPFSELPDMLVPNLDVVAAVLETAALNEAVRRETIAISMAANAIGGFWGWWSWRQQEAVSASSVVDSASLAALAWAWIRLRSEPPEGRAPLDLVDPRPEQWGMRPVAEVLKAFATAPHGLTFEEANRRRQTAQAEVTSSPLLDALMDNVRSPLTAAVAAASGLSLLHGSRADASILALTMAANVAVGTWQEYRTNEIEAALKRREVSKAEVVRDGESLQIPTSELVPGDILLVGHGDRSPADARLLEAMDLEVDEAALTGESFPVTKMAEGGTASHRILLDGSDILTGRGRAIVVAVGSGTRMGATTAAVLARIERRNVLTTSLRDLFWRILPLTLVSGSVVTLAGLLRARPPLGAVLSGASIALAAVPEGLPILAGMGQAAAARRLATRNVLLRRPAAIEALGRVDVACVDKTGTLTEGRPTLCLAATCDGHEAQLPRERDPRAIRLLRAAALASPHPEDESAGRHATDRAVLRAAEIAELGDDMRIERQEESRFDTQRPFHAAIANGRLYLKGAPEWVVVRCSAEQVGDEVRPLDEHGRTRLTEQARELAARGLRVLMIAEAAGSTSVEDPRGLTALGLVGIKDPLRETVQTAVRRCQAAGIRLIMLTGDHPATAEQIAREAGLMSERYPEVLTGSDISGLENAELDVRIERTAVVARTTPLDKLRIVESLRRRGHAIAMTGDGVNDAPALRLADVGVAIGRSATAVARHTADVILDDDDFDNLAEALVEGRSFWHNLRRALALLLGGNSGELGYMAIGSVFNMRAPLTVRQILAINLITDALPAFALAVEKPEHRILSDLERGGPATLGAPLSRAIARRAVATTGPALGAYLLANGTVDQSRTVGFASIVFTQLALTLDAGRSKPGEINIPVTAAVAASGGAMLALMTVPGLRGLFQLAPPTPLGWALIGAAAVVAPLVARIPLPNAVPTLAPRET